MSALRVETAFGQMLGLGGAAGTLAHLQVAQLTTLRAKVQYPPVPSALGPKVPQVAHPSAAANAPRHQQASLAA